MKLKIIYSLFRMDYRQQYLGLRFEPIKTVSAEEEGIKNLTDAYNYFMTEIFKIESDEMRYSTMDHITREGEHFGYFVTVGLRKDNNIENLADVFVD